MHFGILWFLHLYYVIFLSRVSIIPLIIIGFYAPIHSFIFPLAWVLCALALVITILTFPINIPSTEKMKKFIENQETDFVHRIEEKYGKKRNFKMQLLKGYTFGKLKLKNKIDNRPIYPYFVIIALVHTSDEIRLIAQKKSLLTRKPHDQTCLKIDTPETITIAESVYDSTASIKRVIIRYEGNQTEIYTKADYHYNDFIHAIER